MSKNWILDVLVDLKSFARSNGLPKLAAHLEDGTMIALAELASSHKAAEAAVGRSHGAKTRCGVGGAR